VCIGKSGFFFGEQRRRGLCIIATWGFQTYGDLGVLKAKGFAVDLDGGVEC